MPSDIGLTMKEVHRDPHLCVMALSGRLSRHAAGTVTTGLAKALVDTGRVLADVSALEVTWAPAAQLFATAVASAGGWPGARLVLVGPGPDLTVLLRSVRAFRTVSLADDLDDGRAKLDERPEKVRRFYDLPRSPAALGQARALVRLTCQDWGVADPDDDAAMVANELVANAVEHAHTTSRLSIALDRRGLTIAVRDYNPRNPLPAPRPAPDLPTYTRGHGLRVVAAMSQAWGSITHVDGKTVWALLTGPVVPSVTSVPDHRGAPRGDTAGDARPVTHGRADTGR